MSDVGKELWEIEYETIGEEFFNRLITGEEARKRLRRLGFDDDRISDELDAMVE